MKYFSIFLLICISTGMFADEVTHDSDHDATQQIKQRYNNILDSLFAQGLETLEDQREIVGLLFRKNKEEFKDIKNLLSDISIETDFDRQKTDAIKKELNECLKKRIDTEIEKVFEIRGVSADNVHDFLQFSRMICCVTQESDKQCRRMVRTFKKQNSGSIKKLKIIDKAQGTIKAIEKEERKKELLSQLREHIVLGAYPRK